MRYRKEVELIMDKFLRLRHQMIPYLHTMNRRASEEGIPLIQPLYYQNPGKWDAFRMKNEYYFGSDILVNPITQPISTATRMGKVMALLPEGTWIDLFTGTVYNGDRKIELYRSLDSIPVLAKAGAIVTLDARTTGNAIDNPEILKVIVAAVQTEALDSTKKQQIMFGAQPHLHISGAMRLFLRSHQKRQRRKECRQNVLMNLYLQVQHKA